MFKIFKKRKRDDLDRTLDLPRFNRDLDYAVIFARLFANPGGGDVLSYLKKTVLDISLPPQSTPHDLYYQEGRRAVILKILSLVDNGRNKPRG